MNFNKTNFWISGATGAWGTEIIKQLLPLNPLSITAYCHSESRAALLHQKYPSVKIYLGDIRDKRRIYQSLPFNAFVIHTAALKRIDTALYSPTEMSSVNIDGTKVVIEACIKKNAIKCFFISTDKATYPTTFYGATKFLAEQLWRSANDVSYTKFLTSRYGNALWSTGSVLEQWYQAHKAGKPLLLNNKSREITRFLLPLNTAVHHILSTLKDPEKDPRELQPSPCMVSATLQSLVEAFISLYPTEVKEIPFSTPGDKDHECIIGFNNSLLYSNNASALLLNQESVQSLIHSTNPHKENQI